MKRKITKLEQKLISKGYYLSHKQYYGRKSEKTLCYVYVNKSAFVKLDFKRENVLTYGLLNYHALELTRIEMQGIDLLLNMISNDFSIKDNVEPIIKQEKTTVIPISELDEQEEYGAMTFEQFDELCLEKEKEK